MFFNQMLSRKLILSLILRVISSLGLKHYKYFFYKNQGNIKNDQAKQYLLL